MTSQYENEVMLTCAVMGFHYYRKNGNQSLIRHEHDNVFDRFAIKTMKTDSRRTVSHLPVEISRETSFYWIVVLKSLLN